MLVAATLAYFVYFQGYTVEKMFQVADEFFRGIGLPKLSKNFWKKSVLKRVPDVEMECHPSAQDMCYGKGSEDFRWVWQFNTRFFAQESTCL